MLEWRRTEAPTTIRSLRRYAWRTSMRLRVVVAKPCTRAAYVNIQLKTYVHSLERSFRWSRRISLAAKPVKNPCPQRPSERLGYRPQRMVLSSRLSRITGAHQDAVTFSVQGQS